MSDPPPSPSPKRAKFEGIQETVEWTRPDDRWHAHFDCFSGAAGNMMLAACVDAAADNGDKLVKHVTHCLNKGIPELAGEFRITSERVWRGEGSIGAKHIKVESIYEHDAAPVPEPDDSAGHSHEHSHEHGRDHSHEHVHEHSHDHAPAECGGAHKHSHQHSNAQGPLRNLPEIRKMLTDADEEFIPSWVKEKAVDSFTQLAYAEAAVHCAKSIDKVHFHEVGAVDSVVDMVGTILALYALGCETFSCSKLPLGEGNCFTDHGVLPVPAPATMCLMIGYPTTRGPPGVTGELVTPTGAALIRALTRKSPTSWLGQAPSFTVRKIGIGAGTKNFKKHPNIMRLLIGDLAPDDPRIHEDIEAEEAAYVDSDAEC